MKKLIMLKIGVIIEDETVDDEGLDEIGEHIAKDLYMMLYNGEDFLDTEYLGREIVENP